MTIYIILFRNKINSNNKRAKCRQLQCHHLQGANVLRKLTPTFDLYFTGLNNYLSDAEAS